MTTPTNKQLLPLHVHTVYSVLDGASQIDEYISWCKKNGASALGVTDHGWMIGANELIHKCNKNGITPLPGCEFYLVPPVDYDFAKKPYDYYHVTAWAVNEKGYRNLLKLGSISFGTDEFVQQYFDKHQKKAVVGPRERVISYFGGRQRKPRITFEELFQYNEGIVLGSGCLIGALNKAFLNGEKEGAEKNLNRLLEVFRGRLYVELMPHKVTHDWDRTNKNFKHNECTDFSPDGDVQKSCNICSIEIAQKYKLPLLMTVDSHFVGSEQYEIQKVLLQNGDPDGWHFYNSYHMLTSEDAWKHWSAVHGDDKANRLLFAEAVENNHAIAELAKGFKIQDNFQQPEVKIDADLSVIGERERLKVQIIRAIKKHGRMKWGNKAYEERLSQELKVICDNGIHDFSKYFLFLEQWGEWTRQHSILSAPGRGSGAGSLLCYLLKITHLDPFEYKLPFERFLSMGRLKRGKFPDIDWDLGDRDILIAKLQEEYGERFSQCSTHGTLKIKSAIKDACRVILGWNSGDDKVNGLTKNIEMTPQGVLDKDFLLGYTDQDGNNHEGYLDRDPALKKFFDEQPSVFEMVINLLGIPRSVGRHASAYFISDRPISESSPTCTVSGHVCTQFTAAWAEKAGLIKFDFLRVNTLSDISGCIRLVQKRAGYKIWKEKFIFNNEEFEAWQGELPVESIPMKDGKILDVYSLPMDEAVYSQFDIGATETVFQMHTPLLTQFCCRVKPRSINDLSAIVALVRPGPLSALIEDGKTTMTEAYIKRKHGEIPVTYAHSDMEPILKDTYGVAVYQEQLQQMFSDLAGYSSEEADEMREIVGKKKKQQMEKAIPELRSRLQKKNWTQTQIDVFVNLCIASASYSFNRSHSASYASVAYLCMFLKHHFPVEWWTSVLQNAKVEDIREKGYTKAVRNFLEMPHINGPTGTFELRDDNKIHSPIYLIDGVGDAACRAIGQERERNGDYKNFNDFFDRIDRRVVNQSVMHNLILCGMFEKIEPDKSPKDLLKIYHLYKRTLELKIGKNAEGLPKKGKELIEASIAVYKKMLEKGTQLEVPELYSDSVEMEVKKLTSLPIYRLDIFEKFKPLFASHQFVFSEPRQVTYHRGNETITVMRSFFDVQYIHDNMNRPHFIPVGWAGLVQKAEEFSYQDKRKKKTVKALKLQVINDGDAMECILWPEQYAQKGTIKEGTILFCIGTTKPAREAGKWSLSVQETLEL